MKSININAMAYLVKGIGCIKATLQVANIPHFIKQMCILHIAERAISKKLQALLGVGLEPMLKAVNPVCLYLCRSATIETDSDTFFIKSLTNFPFENKMQKRRKSEMGDN